MNSLLIWIAVVAAIIVLLAWLVAKKMPRGPEIPEALTAGKSLPEFSAVDENGNALNSRDLQGQAALLLFVRGNWCPFCTKQVEKLTQHYKDIVDAGARLIFVTPKPLETTRRVAEFFEVDFEFWLDESLTSTKSLGLLMPEGVPADYAQEYGDDTVWPTAIIVDKDGVIRYSKLARYIFDRPNPELLLAEVRKVQVAAS